MDAAAYLQQHTDGSGFDIEKARRSAAVYGGATGTGCFLIDAQGNMLSESRDGGELCRCCREGRLSGGGFSCRDVHRYGCYEAERFGGRYVFFCPIGLTHWISPITMGHAIRGALVGGPVLMVEPEEFMLGDLLPAGLREIRREDFARMAESIPVAKPEVVNSLSELLYIVASQIVSGEDGGHEEKTQSNSVQSKISESLQDLKASCGASRGGPGYPFEKERQLLASISLGDRATAQRILNEILGYIFFSSGMDFEVIRARIQELTVLLSRAAIEGGADSAEVFGMNFRFLSDINRFTTVDELTFWLSQILARFTDCVFNLADVRHKDIIYKAIDYIKQNYMKKMTLEDVARYVYLNPSYFSKIFKDEIGCTYVAYVNRMRVEKSKMLLLDPSVPLTDVSSLMGFEEQSYYTRVFKKLVGMTPGRFRKSMGVRTQAELRQPSQN